MNTKRNTISIIEYFQNILISNLRSNKGSVYSIGNWITKDQDDIIRQLMDVDKMHVTNIIKDIKVDDEKIKNKIEVFFIKDYIFFFFSLNNFFIQLL